MSNQPNGSPRPSSNPSTGSRQDSGGAPAPKHSIPCPPKPKK